MQNSRLVFSIAVVTAMFEIGTANAADLPVRTYSKAPTIAVDPAYNWSGFYVGGNVGGAWNRSEWTDVTGNIIGQNLTAESDGSSVIGGGQIGLNYQVNQFVFGIEGDYDATRIKSSFAADFVNPGCAGAPPGVCTTTQDWIASVRARLGYAFGRAMIYGTGGVAFTNYRHDLQLPGFPALTAVFSGRSRTGWVAGIGGEYAMTDKWIAGVEWKHYDFGTKDGSSLNPLIVNVFHFKETEDSVLARLSYKFGWSSSVVARY